MIISSSFKCDVPKKVESYFSYIDTDKITELTNQMRSDTKSHFFFYFSDLKDKLEGEDDKDDGAPVTAG